MNVRVTSVLFLTVLSLLALGACAKAYEEPPLPPSAERDRRITDLNALPGERCTTAGMVEITLAEDKGTFCMDRFESGVDNGALGEPNQGDDDTDPDPDGSTKATAITGLNITPATMVSWYQAKSACINAGKRLCTRLEWERACRGPAELIYPHGNEPSETACNGFYNLATVKPLPTGSLDTCGSRFGVYDLSGNVEEWVEDGVPENPGATALIHRFVRGGSFRSNRLGLACIGPEFHAAPNDIDADRGFRCCL